MTMPEGVEQQTNNAFRTIIQALNEAGTSISAVCRATYYVTDRSDSESVLRTAAGYFREIRPATSLVVVSGLLHDTMKVEIEVTAKAPLTPGISPRIQNSA